MTVRKTHLALILIFFSNLVFGQNTHDFEEKIDLWRKEYNVPQVGVGIIENGKIKYTKVFGNPDNTTSNLDFHFDMASLTKPVFATLVLKLVDKKLWDLDEPLYNYHIDNEVRDDENLKLLTTKHVLSHQSGFPNWRNLTPSGKLQFHFRPGEKYLYSGEGYEYLRNAVEKKFSMQLQDLAKMYLFDPLGMKNSQFGSAAGGLKTTISDYSTFSVNLLNQEIVSSNIFNEMVKPQVNVKKGIDYGLGWEVVSGLDNNEFAIMHSGSDPGTQTFVLLFPSSKNGIVVFTNADNGNKLYREIIESYSGLGKDVMNRLYAPFVPDTIFELPIEALNEYVGNYRIELGDEILVVKVFMESSKLTAELPSMPKTILYAENENFFHYDENFAFEFTRNSNNHVDKMIIYQSGIESYIGKKIVD